MLLRPIFDRMHCLPNRVKSIRQIHTELDQDQLKTVHAIWTVAGRTVLVANITSQASAL